METTLKSRTLVLGACSALLLAACAAPQPYQAPPPGYPQQQPAPQPTGEPQRSRVGTAAGIGALAGAVIGAVSGDDARERRKRAMIGAGVGALAGGAVGTYMDRQEARMREEMAGTGVEVVRQGDDLILSMPESITFGFDSSELNPRALGVLDRVGNVARDYPQTMLEITGHTDSVGSAAYNDRLSERRAQAVSSYLGGRGVASHRMMVIGAGMRYPIASNSTEAGRAQNRRVEITFMPVRE
jgi:outer membrane protein OmpA-like peptidoglycan-associated protein